MMSLVQDFVHPQGANLIHVWLENGLLLGEGKGLSLVRVCRC